LTARRREAAAALHKILDRFAERAEFSFPFRTFSGRRHLGSPHVRCAAALSGQQADNVIGQGGAPSVRLSNGFTSSQLDNVVVPAILAQPGVVNDPTLNGHDVFGTRLSPQITHFSTSVTINGNLSGFGILIVDQGLTMSGSSTFTGLIIVKGTTQLTATQGDTTILGALWTTDLQLTVGGSASVTYSSQALALVNALFSTPVLPQRVRVVAWGGF